MRMTVSEHFLSVRLLDLSAGTSLRRGPQPRDRRSRPGREVAALRYVAERAIELVTAEPAGHGNTPTRGMAAVRTPPRNFGVHQIGAGRIPAIRSTPTIPKCPAVVDDDDGYEVPSWVCWSEYGHRCLPCAARRGMPPIRVITRPTSYGASKSPGANLSARQSQ
jgi:hypothetical protein